MANSDDRTSAPRRPISESRPLFSANLFTAARIAQRKSPFTKSVHLYWAVYNPIFDKIYRRSNALLDRCCGEKGSRRGKERKMTQSEVEQRQKKKIG